MIVISKLDNFPLTVGDDWSFKVHSKSQLFNKELKFGSKDTFGWKGTVLNLKALNNMSVWVIGDSFTTAIRPYIEASFKEVRYIGHWSRELASVPSYLANSTRKPDLILVVRVERSF